MSAPEQHPPPDTPRAIRFTLFQCTHPLTKGMSLLPTGELHRDSSGCGMSRGDFRTLEIGSINEFAGILSAVSKNQCLAYGVHVREHEGKVVAEAKAKPGDITRSKGEFVYKENEPRILMLDCDFPLTRDQWLAVLYQVCPALTQTARVWRPSTSSHIFTKEGTELRGLTGQRLYLGVVDGVDIPRAGDVLFKRLWLAGHGHIEISRSGAFLKRGPIDAAVFSSERLDFVAGAVCKNGLRQGDLTPEYLDGEALLDTRAALPDLSPEEQAEFDRLVEVAKAEKISEAARIKQAYIGERTEEIAKTRGIPQDEARKVVEAAVAEAADLYGDWLLQFDKHGQVSVSEVLANPKKYDKATLADPLEPQCGGGRNVAKFYANNDGRPVIHSFAHGDKVYYLHAGKPSTDKPPKPDGPDTATANSATRKELAALIEATDDFDELTGPLAERAMQSRLPETSIESLLKAIARKSSVSLKVLKKDVYERVAANKDGLHLKAAREVIKAYGSGNLLYAVNSLWCWDGSGVWRKLDDRAVRRKIHEVAENPALTKAVIDSILDMLKTEVFRNKHQFDTDIRCINVLNGELHFEAGRWVVKPHVREHYRTTQLPVRYDPEAGAPRFEQFLAEVFAPDEDRVEKAAIVCEALGYSLLTTCEYEVFILTIGPGGNGKSVLLAVIVALVGREHAAGVQPCQLDNRFQRAHLHGKLVNIVTEIAEGSEIADAALKAIVSGELVTAEHKHKPPFTFAPYTTCWFGTNHVPRTRDFSDALFRRAIILRFNRKFEGQRRDVHLKEKLRAELPGILNLALDGLARVFEQDAFTQCSSGETAKRDWQLDADQVTQFFEERCEGVGVATSQEIYEAYSAWADEAGIRQTLNRKSFTQRLERLGVIPGKGTGGTRMLHGVRLRSPRFEAVR